MSNEADDGFNIEKSNFLELGGGCSDIAGALNTFLI